MAKVTRNCDYCGTAYQADTRNLKRGWGLCCSKSCAAHKREKSRSDYCPKKVTANNLKREMGRYDHNLEGNIQGYTSEGYRVVGGIAYDEWDDPVYNYDSYEDDGDYGWDSHK